MKYINFFHPEFGEFCVIFPDRVPHVVVSVKNAKPESAGFCDLTCQTNSTGVSVGVKGESTGLNLKPDPDDISIMSLDLNG